MKFYLHVEDSGFSGYPNKNREERIPTNQQEWCTGLIEKSRIAICRFFQYDDISSSSLGSANLCKYMKSITYPIDPRV
jgi:hypothetical protein